MYHTAAKAGEVVEEVLAREGGSMVFTCPLSGRHFLNPSWLRQEISWGQQLSPARGWKWKWWNDVATSEIDIWMHTCEKQCEIMGKKTSMEEWSLSFQIQYFYNVTLGALCFDTWQAFLNMKKVWGWRSFNSKLWCPKVHPNFIFFCHQNTDKLVTVTSGLRYQRFVHQFGD